LATACAQQPYHSLRSSSPLAAHIRTAKLVDSLEPRLRSGFRLSYAGYLYRVSEGTLAQRVLSPELEAAKKLGVFEPKGRGANYGKDGKETPATTTITTSNTFSAAAGTSDAAITVKDPAGGRKLKYIFTPDGRTQVGAMTAFPWRTIGQIDMTTTTGSTKACSGATIGPRAVLTAGHCVHSGPGTNGAAGAWYDVKFSAGRKCATKNNITCNPYGTLSWSHMTTYQAWTNSKDWRWA
jgi:hypothetical protein